jgi:hypothetical protein
MDRIGVGILMIEITCPEWSPSTPRGWGLCKIALYGGAPSHGTCRACPHYGGEREVPDPAVELRRIQESLAAGQRPEAIRAQGRGCVCGGGV